MQFPLQCMKVKSECEAAQSCRLLATPWTAVCQAPPSMGFSRQEYWSGLPLPSPLYIFSSVQFRSVAQLCPTLCDPMDCRLPGSSVHGIFQARILEWGAISFFRGSARPKDRTVSPELAGSFFTTETPGKPNGSVESTLIYKLLQHRLPPLVCWPWD